MSPLPGRLVLTVYVDDVPWRTHGPSDWSIAELARLLDEARLLGLVFTVYASQRSCLAYPFLRELVEGEGHPFVVGARPLVEPEWPDREANEGDVWTVRIDSSQSAASIAAKVKELREGGWGL